MGASRLVELVGGACAYDLSAPASTARIELTRSLSLSGRTQIVRLKGSAFGWASVGAWQRHRVFGYFAPPVSAREVRIRYPGVASAPRGKSLGNLGGAEVSLRQQTIVNRAEQAQIFRYRSSATRPPVLVVNLKKRPR